MDFKMPAGLREALAYLAACSVILSPLYFSWPALSAEPDFTARQQGESPSGSKLRPNIDRSLLVVTKVAKTGSTTINSMMKALCKKRKEDLHCSFNPMAEQRNQSRQLSLEDQVNNY